MAHKNQLCIGDFNQVLSQEDKFSFNDREIEGADLFNQTLFDLGLCELEARGQKFTWMNGRENEAFVMERLDKAYASVEWINFYPHYALQNHPILRLDHGLPIQIVRVQWTDLGRFIPWVPGLSNYSRKSQV